MSEQPSAEVEIGRRYERYVGYRYESAGWRVVYHGITKGVADRGRDLVCYNGSQVQLVQCKCWKAGAKIPRDVIENLAHTAEQYRAKFHDTNQLTLEYPGFKAVRVVPVLISSCGVSWDAWCASKLLHVSLRKPLPFAPHYPKVKVIRSASKYYLPEYLRYDKISVSIADGDCYVATEEEARALGAVPGDVHVGEFTSGVKATYREESTIPLYAAPRSTQQSFPSYPHHADDLLTTLLELARLFQGGSSATSHLP